MYICIYVYIYIERWIVCSDAFSSVLLIAMVRQPLSMYRAVPGMSQDPFNQSCAKDCTTWSGDVMSRVGISSLFSCFSALSFLFLK